MEVAVGHFEHGVQAVGRGFVGSEDAEIVGSVVELDDVAQHVAEHARRLGDLAPGFGTVDGVGAEIRQVQVLQQQAAVGVRIRAHAARALGRQFGEFGDEGAVVVEQLLGPVALHPVFEDLEVLRLGGQLRERDLMGAESAFDLHAVDYLGPGPAFGRVEHDHGPQRALGESVLARVFLDGADFFDDGIERRRHGLMHRLRFVAFDEIRA